jgi:formate/nitrite transporter FocA (FNT family)
LSSLSGGLDVSFSLLLMATMQTGMQNTLPEPITQLLVANMYAVGFIFVVVGRSELFTEHTSRAMFPVMSGYATWLELARLWILVFLGNILGTAVFAAIVALTGPPLGIIDADVLGQLARPFVERSWWLILVSAALAGWLMGLLAWLVSACRETISQIVIVWLVATSIGVARLPHAIVGSAEVLASVFVGAGTTLSQFAYFLVFTTLGNGLGGIFFVAVLKYGHSTRGPDA